MDFTREPIIETVITPKEGCKIVVRSSKNVSQEEYFVDALEVVSFGNAMFFRSLEKPKAFLVPVGDYEILEVREARMVLKNVGLERSIKIGGGREAKSAKEPLAEKTAITDLEESVSPSPEEQPIAADGRNEKKRDRRRQQRRRRGREETKEEMSPPAEVPPTSIEEPAILSEILTSGIKAPEIVQAQVSTSTFISSLLPPPPTLISETIGRYKENVLFKNAFYTKEEKEEGVSKTEEGPKEEDLEKISKIVENHKKAAPEEASSPFASFWDDINEPFIPPMPFIQKTEGEEPLSPESPTNEENK